MQTEGFTSIKPQIKKILFPKRGKMEVVLCDGRMVIVPISAFPSIKKLSENERKDWYILGDGFSFENSNEVFHIEQILGDYDNYKHN